MSIAQTPPTGNPPTGTPPARRHQLHRFTGQLVARLADLAAAPAWTMSADELRESLVEAKQAVAQLEALTLRMLAAADRADAGADTGATSVAAWLAHRTRADRRETQRDLRLSHDLDADFRTTAEALAAGRLSLAQARVVVAAVQALPETVGAIDRRRAERHLVDLARDYEPRALKALGRHLLEVVDPEGADAYLAARLAAEERRAAATAYLRLTHDGHGATYGEFKIPTLHGAMLTKVLHAFASPRRPGAKDRSGPDGRRPNDQVLGQALLDLLERLPAKRLPRSGGINATVVVTMSYDVLLGRLQAVGLDTGQEISPGEARRLACEAGIIPMVLGGASQPLDLGRRRRFHSEPQRVAIHHRDRSCTAESCDRPTAWTHIHHKTPWSRGGRTSVENGVALCSRHHTLAHDPRYEVAYLPSGRTRFSRIRQ